jgi:hypothetical protein
VPDGHPRGTGGVPGGPGLAGPGGGPDVPAHRGRRAGGHGRAHRGVPHRQRRPGAGGPAGRVAQARRPIPFQPSGVGPGLAGRGGGGGAGARDGRERGTRGEPRSFDPVQRARQRPRGPGRNRHFHPSRGGPDRRVRTHRVADAVSRPGGPREGGRRPDERGTRAGQVVRPRLRRKGPARRCRGPRDIDRAGGGRRS